MARPKNIENENEVLDSEKQDEPKQKKQSVIFMGSGKIWGDKKILVSFNKNYLFETNDELLIEKLRELNHPEVTEREIRTLFTGGNYELAVRNILKNGKQADKTPGALSQDEIDEVIRGK
jgi:hypothetical protein